MAPTDNVLRILFLLILSLVWCGRDWCFAADAQMNPPDFEWVAQAGGKDHDKTRGLCLDAQGNIFITGEFAGTAQFGDTTLTSAGLLNYFVAKLSPAGKFLWARSGGGSKIDRGYGVAADAAGNCYVTGHYQSSDATFDGHPLPPAVDYDIFIAKYDAGGKLLWIKTAGGAGYDYGHGIAVNAAGNVFVTGAVVGDCAFGDVKITNEKTSHLFCACYDAEGNLAWLKTAQGKASNAGNAITVDGSGNAYIGGQSGGVGTLGNVALANPKGRDVLIVKFTPEGDVGWVHQGFGSPSALIHQISAEKDGHVWASGMFRQSLNLGGGKTVKSKGDSKGEKGDKSDNDILLTHLDPAGNRLWTITGGSPKVDYGLGIAVDAQGNGILTGEFSDTMELLGATLTSRGVQDIFVAGIDRQGKLRWLTQAGGPLGDNAYTIAVDAQGAAFISGSFSAEAKFGPHTVKSAGRDDVYVAKIKAQ